MSCYFHKRKKCLVPSPMVWIFTPVGALRFGRKWMGRDEEGRFAGGSASAEFGVRSRSETIAFGGGHDVWERRADPATDVPYGPTAGRPDEACRPDLCGSDGDKDLETEGVHSRGLISSMRGEAGLLRSVAE